MSADSEARAFVRAAKTIADDESKPAGLRRAMADLVRDFGSPNVGPHVALTIAVVMSTAKAIEALHQRIAELENRPTMRYCGTHVPGKAYEPGAMVTSSGSLWACTAPTTARPGDGAPGWQLAAKKGRDGR